MVRFFGGLMVSKARCTACRLDFKAIEADDGTLFCPRCNSSEVKRLAHLPLDNEEEGAARSRRSDADGCAELLARLIKFHPEHEAPACRNARLAAAMDQALERGPRR